MTERLLAALADNGKWLEGFTRLGYESTFREYCDRFTPDYLAAVREAGESGLPALADSRSEERRVGKECRSRWSPYH